MTMTLITTNTESSDSESVFSSSIDSTYKLYIFSWINVNPETDNTVMTVDFSIDSGSNYNLNITSLHWTVAHTSDDAVTDLDKVTSYSQHGEDDPQEITASIGNAATENSCGNLWLFNPAGTTYSKMFSSTSVNLSSGAKQYANHNWVDGKIMTTSAVNTVKFTMDSGDFDGTFKMYGVK